jgi:hypothetical protein
MEKYNELIYLVNIANYLTGSIAVFAKDTDYTDILFNL